MKKRISAVIVIITVILGFVPLALLSPLTYENVLAARSAENINTAGSSGMGGYRYSKSYNLADGLKYTNVVYWHDEYGREEGYELRYTPGGGTSVLSTAGLKTLGGDTIDDITALYEKRGYNVLGAVNTDFFNMNNGCPIGIVIENGRYISSGNDWAAAYFDQDGQLRFTEDGGADLVFTFPWGAAHKVPFLNKPLFEPYYEYAMTADFGETTAAAGTGWYVKLRFLTEPAIRADGESLLAVTEKSTYTGKIPIAHDELVIIQSTAPNDAFDLFNIGDTVALGVSFRDAELSHAVNAFGCGDMLVREGVITDDAAWDKDLKARSPKTAIGITAEGETVVLAVDGRNSTYANGITLAELAYEMAARSCVYAVNLDGGGSTAMSARLNGASVSGVLNRPSDGKQRKCGTYLVFCSNTRKEDGIGPSRLVLEQNGALVLAGSEISLTAAVLDFADVAISGAENAQFSAEYGTVTVSPEGETLFKASDHAGIDTIYITSSDGSIYGTGEIFTVVSPTSIYLTDTDGKAIASMEFTFGDTYEFLPTCTYHRLSVVSQYDAFQYKCEQNIGAFTETTLYTASGGGNGRILISAGNTGYYIKVFVHPFTDTIGHWAEGFVDDLYAKHITYGASSGKYNPEANMTRADFVTMLYRAAGKPYDLEEPPNPLDIGDDALTIPLPGDDETGEDEPDDDEPGEDEPEEINRDGESAESSSTTPFTDVLPGTYYYNAVHWAKDNNITYGTGDGLFDPQGVLTREQAVSFVYRALDCLGSTPSIREISQSALAEVTPEILRDYPDVSDLSGYAETSMTALVGLHIIVGSEGMLLPHAPLTRAQMAKILSATLRLSK